MKTFLQGLLISAVASLAPIKAVIVTVGILILADLISGVFAAKKRKSPITSAKLRNSVTKCLVYQTAVITGYLVQMHLLQNFIPVVNVVGSLIGLTELTSLYENFNVILGGSVFKRILVQLGSANLDITDNHTIKETIQETAKPHDLENSEESTEN